MANSNQSGHYQPAAGFTYQAIEMLRRAGLNIAGAQAIDVTDHINLKTEVLE